MENLLSAKSKSQPVPIEWEILLEAVQRRTSAQRLSGLLSRRIDPAFLLALAEQHSLVPALAERLLQQQLGVSVPTELRHVLHEQQRSHAIFTLGLLAEMFRVLECLAAANIEALLIKGPVLAVRCYGDAGARQYTDVDLIVRTKNIERCTQIMVELGYEAHIPVQAIRAGKKPGEYVFRRAGTIIEFHTEDTFRYYPRGFSIEGVFARKTWVNIDQHGVPALSVEDELILVCIHAAKHVWKRLAWVADVAALLSNSSLDWQAVISAARDVGAERMLRVGLLLASEMLGAPVPAAVVSYVHTDKAASQLAQEIARRLHQGSGANPGILGRAVYRMKMTEGLLAGLAYLLRLSFSPTEEDWSDDSEAGQPGVVAAMSRPFRLARKYRREV